MTENLEKLAILFIKNCAYLKLNYINWGYNFTECHLFNTPRLSAG